MPAASWMQHNNQFRSVQTVRVSTSAPNRIIATMTSWWICVCALALVQAIVAHAPTSQLVNTKNNSGVLDVDEVGGEGNVVDSADENNLNSPHTAGAGGGGGGGGAGGGGGGGAVGGRGGWSHRVLPTTQTVNSDGNSGIETVDTVGGRNNYVKSRDHNDHNSPHYGGGGGGGPIIDPIQILPVPAPRPRPLPWRPLPRWNNGWLARYEFNPTYQQLNSVNNRGIEDLDATGGSHNKVEGKDQNSINSPAVHSFLSLDDVDQHNPTEQAVNDNQNSGILDADATGGTANAVKSDDQNNVNSPHSQGWRRPVPLSFLSDDEEAVILPVPVWIPRRRGTHRNPTRQSVNSNANRGIEDIDATGGSNNKVVSSDHNDLNSPHQRSWLQSPDEVEVEAVGKGPAILPWPRPWSGGNHPTSQVVNSNGNSGVIDADATGGLGNSVLGADENNINSPHTHGGRRRGGGGGGVGAAGGGGGARGQGAVRIGGAWRIPLGGNHPTSQVVNANNNSGILDADATGGSDNNVDSKDKSYLNSPHYG